MSSEHYGMHHDAKGPNNLEPWTVFTTLFNSAYRDFLVVLLRSSVQHYPTLQQSWPLLCHDTSYAVASAS